MLPQFSIEPPLQTQPYHKKGHCLQAMHTIGKDCLLHCSEHPHWHRAQRDIGKFHDDPAELRYVTE